MTDKLSVTIDGRSCSVSRGTSLIEAASAAGVRVPNLCHLDGMKGVGACRLCVVEVEGSDAPVTACTTRVKDGMVVSTDTERVREIRRFVLDLILSMHPSDCMTCAKAGVCDLQQYAFEHELSDSTFTRKVAGRSTDDANPFVSRRPDYCILCGRCVRVCEAQGTSVLRFDGRGLGSRVVSGSDTALEHSDCTFCGNCVDACPVGALLPVEPGSRGREWENAKTRTTCLSCGCGCDVVASVNGGRVVKVESAAAGGGDGRFICAVGRFGYEGLQGHLRVSRPLVRVDGELVDAEWDEALALVAAKMKGAAGGVGIVAGGTLLNEDALLLKKLAEGVLRTDHYDSSASLYGDADVLSTPGARLDEADLIVLVGLAPDQWTRVLPALDAAIRERVRSGKARLVVVNAGSPRIAAAASVVVEGDEARSLEQVFRALVEADPFPASAQLLKAVADVEPSPAAREAAALYLASESPLILVPPSLYSAAANLATLQGRVVAVPFEANARGLAHTGLRGSGWSFERILDAPVPVLYAIGALPVERAPQADFVVVQTPFLTDLARQADVVLPAATALESEGSVIDALGRVKHVRRACEPLGGARQDGEVFTALADAMGVALHTVELPEADSTGDQLPEVDSTGDAVTAATSFGRRVDWDVDPARLVEAARRPVLEGSRLCWLSESGEGRAA